MTLKLKVRNGFISILSAIASLRLDCRSLQCMFGWGRGKSFADCLEFAGLFFRNTKLGRVCSAVSHPHGVAAALVVPFLRYHSGGFLWNTHDFEFGEIHIFLPAALKGGFACEIREAGNCFLILCLSWESLNNLCSVRGAYFHCW